MWLLCDTRYEAADNAYWLFQYLRKRQPETDAVFALDKRSRHYSAVSKLGEVVPYGSLKHWIYYLAAEKNVSSQKMGKPNAAVCYLLEVYGLLKNKRAFLQHGIITADLTFLHYPHTKMSLFVCSTNREWSYVNRVYEYPPGIVQMLGLCRFDGLHHFQANHRMILVMPTWRMYIRNSLAGKKREQRQREFMKTCYFQRWNGLLKNKRLTEFARENNLTIVFYPHREMTGFLDCFRFESGNVRIASPESEDVQPLLKEAAFLITDFSSVAMDFAYMKKPLLYYQFDNEDFRSSHHPKGDFDFETDGFGPVLTDEEQVVETLIRSWNHGFVMDSLYLERHKSYFNLYDNENCRRNYEAIKAL